MPTLGQELQRLRSLKGWTLRDVEAKTGKRVSNSYLYQLESDNVKGPSPNVLYELSVVYGASYPEFMRLAGFIVPVTSQNASLGNASVAFDSLDLTEKERDEVMDFVEFIRRKRKKRLMK